MRDPNKIAYAGQKFMAKKRGIDFLLSYEEWLHIWETSGKLPLRGRGRGKYCMARNNDIGPYALHNVTIQLNEKNISDGNKDRWKNKFVSQETKNKIRLARQKQKNIGNDRTTHICTKCNKIITGKSNLIQHTRAKHA